MSAAQSATGPLTDEDKFLFDLRGFLVVKNVLGADECAELVALADAVWPREPEDGPYRRCNGISRWHQRFVDLIDHDKLLPYLIELVGSRLRIDHDYCIFMRKAAGNPHPARRPVGATRATTGIATTTA